MGDVRKIRYRVYDIFAERCNSTADQFMISGKCRSASNPTLFWKPVNEFEQLPRGVDDFVAVIVPAARTTWGSFDTSASTNAKVIMKLAENRMELLGQVHSHPGSLVGHSKGDDQKALMPYEGFLSIIVPHYGRRGMLPLSTCGVHIFENLHFRRMKRTEIESTFRIVGDIADLRQ